MTLVAPIEDAADARIEPYRRLRDRDLMRDGSFIAEGEVVLRKIVRMDRHRLVSVLLAQARVGPLSSVLEQLGADVAIYSAPQAVLDDIVGFELHRGVLAFGRRAPAVPPESLLAGIGPDAIVLGLFGIANHDNVGGIFRNASAFGVQAILLDAGCCDPLYRKAIRVSVGSALTLPFARLKRDRDAVTMFRDFGFDTLSLSPAGETPLKALRRSGRTALLLGSEGAGLPPDLLARTRTVSIPMAPGFDSLNVATTSGIVLHHLATS